MATCDVTFTFNRVSFSSPCTTYLALSVCGSSFTLGVVEEHANYSDSPEPIHYQQPSPCPLQTGSLSLPREPYSYRKSLPHKQQQPTIMPESTMEPESALAMSHEFESPLRLHRVSFPPSPSFTFGVTPFCLALVSPELLKLTASPGLLGPLNGVSTLTNSFFFWSTPGFAR